MTSRPPLTGYNHNIKYRSRVYHVQTEDYGVDNPRVDSQLYYSGMVIAAVRTEYLDLVQVPEQEKKVRKVMQEQHKRLMMQLLKGEFDQKIMTSVGSLEPEELKVRAVDEAMDAVEEVLDQIAGEEALEPLAEPAEFGRAGESRDVTGPIPAAALKSQAMAKGGPEAGTKPDLKALATSPRTTGPLRPARLADGAAEVEPASAGTRAGPSRETVPARPGAGTERGARSPEPAVSRPPKAATASARPAIPPVPADARGEKGKKDGLVPEIEENTDLLDMDEEVTEVMQSPGFAREELLSFVGSLSESRAAAKRPLRKEDTVPDLHGQAAANPRPEAAVGQKPEAVEAAAPAAAPAPVSPAAEAVRVPAAAPPPVQTAQPEPDALPGPSAPGASPESAEAPIVMEPTTVRSIVRRGHLIKEGCAQWVVEKEDVSSAMLTESGRATSRSGEDHVVSLGTARVDLRR